MCVLHKKNKLRHSVTSGFNGVMLQGCHFLPLPGCYNQKLGEPVEKQLKTSICQYGRNKTAVS